MTLDYSPYGSEDDLPGEPYEAAALGKRYTDTADEIKDCVARLRRIADNAGDVMRGKTAQKFPSMARELADRVEKAEDRYRKSGAALTTWSGKMDTAQWAAAQAAEHGREAQSQVDAHPLPDPPAPGSPPPTDAQVTHAQQVQQANAQGSKDLEHWRREFDNHKDDYDSWARECKQAIEDASHDSLKDGFWYRHFHGWSKFLTILSIVLVIVAVVILVVLVPYLVPALLAFSAESAGFLAGAAAVTATTISGAAVVVDVAAGVTAVAVLVNDLGGKVMGFDVSGKTIAWDVVGVATIGLTKFVLGPKIAKMVKGAEESGQAAAKTTAAERAFDDWLDGVEAMPTVTQRVEALLKSNQAFEAALAKGDEAAEAFEQSLDAVAKSARLPTNLLLKLRESPGELAKLHTLALADPSLEAEFERAVRLQAASGGITNFADAGVNSGALNDMYNEMVEKGELDDWLATHDPTLLQRVS